MIKHHESIQGGSDKSGIFFFLLSNDTAQLKSSDLVEVKANLRSYISRIILFIKTAVRFNNSLDPGPQALEGLHHGVPVEGPQHLLHLLDQILGFVARLFNDPYFRFAPHKIAKKVTIRQVMRSNLLPLHLRNLP